MRSEYFVGKHLSVRSMMFKDYNFENLLVDCHHIRGGDNGLQFSAVDVDTLSVVRSKFKIVSSSPDSVNHPHPRCLFAGSCNGIVCLLVQLFVGLMPQQSLLLWNPATGEVKDLQYEKVIDDLGFGFDPKKNDYKVVSISYSSTLRLTEHMYSSRSDSWKSLDRPHWLKFDHFTSTTSSGGRMLNWLGSHSDTHHRIVISFDLSEEAFVTTPMPPGIETKCKCGWNLQLYHLIQNTPDKPCTVVCSPSRLIRYDKRECACFDNKKIIHIWILNEYGERGSWTKLRSVVVMSDYVWGDDLLVLWKGGEEVLLEIKQHKREKLQLASYNLITQQLRFLGLKGRPCLGYIESLVSINGRYGGGLLLDDPNDIEDIDDSKKKQNYYSLVDDSTGRTISRFHMATLIGSNRITIIYKHRTKG
ncbi:hypothetical protein Dimus_032456 [Dionaea muscipula]